MSVSGFFPVVLSAIDPDAEARLLHLGHAVVAGRYLRESDAPFVRYTRGGGQRYGTRFVPVLASSETFVSDRLQIAIERLHAPADSSLPLKLDSPSGSTFAGSLSGTVIAQRSIGSERFYQTLLAPSATTLSRLTGSPVITFDGAWRPAAVRYRALGPTVLRPVVTHNPASVWSDPSYPSNGGFFPAPPDNKDVQFRALRRQPSSNYYTSQTSVYGTPALEVVGRFSQRLPGFAPLSRVPLETYYPPTLTGGDAASRHALRGRPLRPTQNLGGYIAQPPLLLTTLAGLKPFLNPTSFPGLPRRERRAPISVIRIRVAGVKGPDKLSQQRIKTLAQLIHDRTGLDVDVTAGSSPTPMTIRLPAGRFGRPPLRLQEGWVKKGVAVSYLRALDRKDLALFGLILLVCALFVVGSALAAVRARRFEIGILRTLGWSRARIFSVIFAELLSIGLLSGAAGAGLAALLAEALRLSFPLTRALYVIPTAVALCGLAGSIPAWQATRGRPLDALRTIVPTRRRRRIASSIPELALVNLRRVPARTALAILALAVGVASLAILIAIEHSFEGVLVGTLLGSAVTVQVRGADFVAVILMIVLAAGSVAEVLYLNLRERAAEIAALRAVGWSTVQLGTLIAVEAAGFGVIAGLGGGILAFAVAIGLLGVPAWPTFIAVALAASAGVAAALLASVAPLARLTRLDVPRTLASE